MKPIYTSLNQIRLIGVVCMPVEKVLDKEKNLWTQTRLRLDTIKKQPVYVDVVASGSVAQNMNVLCTLGSKIFAHCHFYNDMFVNKDREKRALLCIRVDQFKRLAIPKKERMKSLISSSKDAMDLISILHPDNFKKGV